MATTHLSCLSLEAFKSFEKQSSVDFPKSGLVLIRGTRDDGISSGTGKTTLLNAITHALKYCPESGTEVQSWLTEKPAKIVLEMLQGDRSLCVTRGPKSSLEIVESRGSEKITGAAAIDTHLEKNIGLPPELLAALTYRQQKSPGLFLSKPDADKKSFLSLILGLSSLEDEVEKAQDTIKALDKELVVLQTTLSQKIAYLGNEVQKVPNADLVDEAGLEQAARGLEAERNLAQAQYHAAKKALEDHQSAISFKVSQMKTAFAGVQQKQSTSIAMYEGSRPVFPAEQWDRETVEASQIKQMAETRLSALRTADLARQKELRTKLDALKLDIYQRETEGATLPKLQDRVSELHRQQNDSKCPTCEQPWHKTTLQYNSFNTQKEAIEAEIDRIADRYLEVSMLKSDVQKLEAQILEVDPKIAQFEGIIKNQADRLADIRTDRAAAEAQFYTDFNKTLADMKADLQSARLDHVSAVAQYESEQKVLTDALRTAAEGLLAELSGVERRISEAKSNLEHARAMNRVKLAAVEAHRASVRKCEEAVNVARGDVAAKEAQIAAEKDFVKLVGREGFLGNIFSEVLVEIATEANKILKNVPNVAHVTVRFKNESITGKGSVKKVITPVVTIAGIERPLGAALSGGMRTVVDLAVDLATRRVVTRRSGHNPAWMILDECMEGLSAIEKECIMHILKQFSTDCLILVVDHASEFKELFDKVIEVVNVNGRSSLKG